MTQEDASTYLLLACSRRVKPELISVTQCNVIEAVLEFNKTNHPNTMINSIILLKIYNMIAAKHGLEPQTFVECIIGAEIIKLSLN